MLELTDQVKCYAPSPPNYFDFLHIVCVDDTQRADPNERVTEEEEAQYPVGKLIETVGVFCFSSRLGIVLH